MMHWSDLDYPDKHACGDPECCGPVEDTPTIAPSNSDDDDDDDGSYDRAGGIA